MPESDWLIDLVRAGLMVSPPSLAQPQRESRIFWFRPCVWSDGESESCLVGCPYWDLGKKYQYWIDAETGDHGPLPEEMKIYQRNNPKDIFRCPNRYPWA